MELPRAMRQALRYHYPEYLIEAVCLGIFLVMASVVTTVLEHPASPLHLAIAHPVLRRMLIGLGMGGTAIALIYSPWGQQSGAHLNPVVTLTFWRLGKVKRLDAVFYILAQFIGAIIGAVLAAQMLGAAIAHPNVNYIVTVPGTGGNGIAFIAEIVISFGLMLMVLVTSNHPVWARFTGLLAGGLITLYITVEAPLSGMSMNPARTLASGFTAQDWTAMWIYFIAPLLGMLVAAEVFVHWQGRAAVLCAKLHHHNRKRCIFNCGYRQLPTRNGSQQLSDRLL